MSDNFIYTIGHSNRTIDDFINILLAYKIDMVIDVRSIPGSNKYSQYNKENIEESLKKCKIKYKHISSLGGLRKKTSDISSNINNYWQNKSFKNYANYAFASQEFDNGLEELLELSNKNIIAIMCAEAVWWRCHRRIITDYLILFAKRKVFHIFDEKNVKRATSTEAAHLISKRKILYSID